MNDDQKDLPDCDKGPFTVFCPEEQEEESEEFYNSCD